MILDKLLEKKDVLAYIGFRIKSLEKDKEKIPHTFSESARERAFVRLCGRIRELNRLAHLVQGGNVRKESVKISMGLRDYKQGRKYEKDKRDNMPMFLVGRQANKMPVYQKHIVAAEMTTLHRNAEWRQKVKEEFTTGGDLVYQPAEVQNYVKGCLRKLGLL